MQPTDRSSIRDMAQSAQRGIGKIDAYARESSAMDMCGVLL